MTQESVETTLTERLDKATDTLDKLFDDVCVLRQSMFNLIESLLRLANDLEELERRAGNKGDSQ